MILSSPDTLQVCLYGLLSMAFKSTVLCLPNHAWSSRFLLREWNFLNHLVTDQLHLLHNKCWWLLLWHYRPVWTCKVLVPKLNNIACLSVHLSNHSWGETMHNVSVHQLAWYYQPQKLPILAWIAFVTWYTHSKLIRTTKILQNFWLILV